MLTESRSKRPMAQQVGRFTLSLTFMNKKIVEKYFGQNYNQVLQVYKITIKYYKFIKLQPSITSL